MPEYAKIKRELFRKSMPDNLKKAFIILVQHHPALGQSDKDFVCDNIHHYETIDEVSRTDVLDVLDGMDMFVVRK
jgi:hypothetical protein